MKLFGNAKKPEAQAVLPDLTGPLPSFPDPEAAVEFDLSDKEFEDSLKLLLDGEDLESSEQLQAEPPKEMGEAINTDYHLASDPIRGTKVVFEDEEPKKHEISGTVKGILLLLLSVAIFAFVAYSVYINLI